MFVKGMVMRLLILMVLIYTYILSRYWSNLSPITAVKQIKTFYKTTSRITKNQNIEATAKKKSRRAVVQSCRSEICSRHALLRN